MCLKKCPGLIIRNVESAAGASSARGCIPCRPGWPKPCKVPWRKRSVVPAPDVAQNRGLKFQHDVRKTTFLQTNAKGKIHVHRGLPSGHPGGRQARLKHKFLDGGPNDVTLATLGKVLLEPTLTAQEIFWCHTLSAFAWNIVRTYTLTPERYSFGCRASNLVMYVSAADDYVGGYRHLPRHALAGRLEHGAPELLGSAGRNREAALRSLGG